MRVALCCKEGLFSEALASLLDHQGSFEVVATETSTRALVSAAKEERAHVLLIDAHLLTKEDVQFLLGARAFGDFAVALISSEDAELDEGAVDRIIDRDADSEELFAVLAELGGDVKSSRPVVREGRKPYGSKEDNALSRREYEVAQLVAKGMSNRRIAQTTGLREQSVKNLVSVVMRKLGCENRVQ
ncbi:response regulator transcription factor, partial [bacterium]